MTCPTDCQYSKDVGMWPEHRCAVKCQYATPPPAPTAAEQAQPECDIPPNGWRCTRGFGHSGPCAAIEDTRSISAKPLHWAKGYAVGYADGVKDATPAPEQAQPAGVTEDARDAARYRWLRERNAVMDSFPIFTACRITASDGTFSHNELICFEQMDAAIDAARAQEGEKP